MKHEKIQVRNIESADLPAALQLVESVSWNQTEEDLKLFLEGENSIYLVAEMEGQLVGTVASIQYGMDIAWVSMMIVAEAFRGQGVGRRLLNTLLQQLKKRGYRTIKLDATPAGRPVYEKLGFREEYMIHRFIHPQWPGFTQKLSGNEPSQITEKDLPALIRLDQAIFGANRTALIDRLRDESPGYVLKKENKIVAYAFGRQGRLFYQIGPVSGNRFEEVQFLLVYILKTLIGKAVVLDVLIDKTSMMIWLANQHFVFQRSLCRMYLDINNSPGEPNRKYCIAGPEFG